MSDILVEIRAGVGLITLNRPKALNALSLAMIRDLTATLLAWRDDPAVEAVAIRGQGKEGPFGAFCAGGDIRFFHQAALAGDPRLEDFFTEEYSLNHLFHQYPKPYIGVPGRHRDGRRHGHLAGRQPAHRHRAHEDGHAGNQHRPVSRRRRRLLPVALSRAASANTWR